MTKNVDGCVKPSRGPILDSLVEENTEPGQKEKEIQKMVARVGKAAPDFELSAFLDGGFKNIKIIGLQRKVDRCLLLSRRFHLCLTD